MLRNPARTSGLYIGTVPEQAAAARPSTTIMLDHSLDVLPDVSGYLTVGELADHIDDMAARLYAAGVRASDQVAIYKNNNFDIYVLASASARIGAVPVMLSPALDGESAAALLARLDRPYLLTDDTKLDGALAGADLVSVTHAVLSVSAARDGVVSLQDLAGSPRREPVLLAPDQPALMTHTSGTTGLPKLVVHSHRSLFGRYRPQRRLGKLLKTGDTAAIHLSYVHSRMYLGMAVLLQRGLHVAVVNDTGNEKIAELFGRIRPAFVETHPNSFMEWEELVDDPRRPFSNVACFSSTFDAIHPGTMDRLLKASQRTNPVFFQIYGQSECGPLTGRHYTRKNAHKADGRCLGYPMPGITKYRLVPRNGLKPSRENPGYIEVSTPGRAVGYYGEKERFEKQAFGKWWRGGDVGFSTKVGCLHLLDREVDVIPGIHSTLEVEDAVLQRLEELAELVLVPGPNQEALPVVCTRQGEPLDLARWKRAVADLPKMAEPIQIPLAELPRTATMKVQRIKLASILREQLEAAS
ncbi:class I adenylate-forming enzyme family protein [Streptomyces sp. NPDC006487]|uniref:class I adenylate-forming enzyme family protein n=1 Tax=Streptomyces sp. NPDC006487 TaxID=3364748 RepID=UPI0036CD3C75